MDVLLVLQYPDATPDAKGRVYDRCCGSGGRIADNADHGQESNHTGQRLAMMNLVVRGIDADIRWNSEGSVPQGQTA